MIDRLHYISQPAADGSHTKAIRRALEAGCRWIQLRIKGQPHPVMVNWAKQAAELCTQFDAKLIINDYPEIALTVGAHGVHLGLDDMPVKEARSMLGKHIIIGGTANTFEQVIQRVEEGVDYIGLGPFRYTSTKKNLSPLLGLQGLDAIMWKMLGQDITTPVVAIGGIGADDVKLIMRTGVHGVAIAGAINNAPDPGSTVSKINQILHSLTALEKS